MIKKLWYRNLKVCLLKNCYFYFPADHSLSSTVKSHWNSKFCLVFKGSYLKEENAVFTSSNIVNLSIVYQLDRWSQDLNADVTLKCLGLLS